MILLWVTQEVGLFLWSSTVIIWTLSRDLATEIAKKVTALMKKEKNKEAHEDNEDWNETEDEFVCQCCLVESHSFDLPKGLRKIKRGNFVFLSKYQEEVKVIACKKLHQKNLLHKW